MRNLFLTFAFFSSWLVGCSQDMGTIRLNEPDKTRKATLMQAFSDRKSTREFSPKMLTDQDLSDLLWAANGINRPESGKRTAPSAMNRQDILVYVCTARGAYLYDHRTHSLEPVTTEDIRTMKEAPLCLVLVADGSGNEPWGAMDAGIVSQNISLVCAGAGLATVPRGTMDKEAIGRALGLKAEQIPMLNHPVGYFKK